MALEPVNERPIFPQLIRADALGVSGWSTSMIRQLTTVFQQYGYRINHSVLADPSIPVADLNDIAGIGMQLFKTASETNLPAGVAGEGLLLHMGREVDRRTQIHISDGGSGTVPAIHVRAEGSSGFGNWYAVTLTEVT